MSYQTIYTHLRAEGISRAGALALLGNWDCESNCEPCRVQGDFSADRAESRRYADRVDNGFLSEEDFFRDGRGWGLAQWSDWTRKRALLDFCRGRSISIANEEAQVDFALQELATDYTGLLCLLRECGMGLLHDAVERVCREFERPAVCNTEARYQAALRLSEMLGEEGTAAGEEPDEALVIFWPPRMLCLGMTGPDVQLLQSALLCHGYNPGGVSGVYDVRTRNMVIGFQASAGLEKDGLAGPKTFRALGVMA